MKSLVYRNVLNASARVFQKAIAVLHQKQMSSNGASDSKWRLEERQGDLFQATEACSLAHCVSQDLHMGKGIATAFKDKFGRVEELKKQGKKPGEVAVLDVEGRQVYYLVTKTRYSHKPTYASLQASLEAMRDHCLQAGVSHLAMPRIGCGLDGLQWDRVKTMLSEVFGHTSIAITIYSL